MDDVEKIVVPAAFIPEGARLVEAYLTDKELVVCGEPPEDENDDSHNCDEMGCTTFSHVVLRFWIKDAYVPSRRVA